MRYFLTRAKEKCALMVFESFSCSCIYAKFAQHSTVAFAQYKENSEWNQFMLATVERELLARHRATEHLWQWKQEGAEICSCQQAVTYNGMSLEHATVNYLFAQIGQW